MLQERDTGVVLGLQPVCSVLINQKTKTNPCCPETREVARSSWRSSLPSRTAVVWLGGRRLSETQRGDAGGRGERGVGAGSRRGDRAAGATASLGARLGTTLGAGREASGD